MCIRDRYNTAYYRDAEDYFARNNYRIMRYADILMNYAECLVETGTNQMCIRDRSLAEFYLRKTDGIFRTQEEIDNYVTKGNHVPGPNEDLSLIRI